MRIIVGIQGWFKSLDIANVSHATIIREKKLHGILNTYRKSFEKNINDIVLEVLAIVIKQEKK